VQGGHVFGTDRAKAGGSLDAALYGPVRAQAARRDEASQDSEPIARPESHRSRMAEDTRHEGRCGCHGHKPETSPPSSRSWRGSRRPSTATWQRSLVTRRAGPTSSRRRLSGSGENSLGFEIPAVQAVGLPDRKSRRPARRRLSLGFARPTQGRLGSRGTLKVLNKDRRGSRPSRQVWVL